MLVTPPYVQAVVDARSRETQLEEATRWHVERVAMPKVPAVSVHVCKHGTWCCLPPEAAPQRHIFLQHRDQLLEIDIPCVSAD